MYQKYLLGGKKEKKKKEGADFKLRENVVLDIFRVPLKKRRVSDEGESFTRKHLGSILFQTP